MLKRVTSSWNESKIVGLLMRRVQSPPANAKPNVTCCFCRLKYFINCQRKKKVEINNKDEYDEVYGKLLEYGTYTVEEYYYIKGWTLGQAAYHELAQNK